jgi:hypothetical protein
MEGARQGGGVAFDAVPPGKYFEFCPVVRRCMNQREKVGVETVVAGVSCGLHVGIMQGAACTVPEMVPDASEGIKRTIMCS